MTETIITILALLTTAIVIVGFLWRIHKQMKREQELCVAVEKAKSKEEILSLADKIEPISPSTASHMRTKAYLRKRGFI